MRDVLIVVDMQNDFVYGSLGTSAAKKIVPYVRKKIEKFRGDVIFTRDTHCENYLETQEGKKLPIKHCIKGTEGWEIIPELSDLVKDEPIDKETFGSKDIGEILLKMDKEEKIGSITLIGLCTDICVISNAMIIKAFLPEVPIIIDSKACAGVSEESHNNALQAMQVCQIEIRGEEK